MMRQMIKINLDKCNGCGICIQACHEGALELIDGKAQIIKDDYCDGLGNCLPVCPMDAISFEMREAVDFDEEAVVENMIKLGKEVPDDLKSFIKKDSKQQKNVEQSQSQNKNTATEKNLLTPTKAGTPLKEISLTQNNTPHKCPGSMAKSFSPQNSSLQSLSNHQSPQESNHEQSQLRQWPVQIKLAPSNASFFDNAHLLIAADCSAYSYANFHKDFMRNKVTLIGCPKLDDVDYTEKLTEIISNHSIKSVTLVRMEVPCCSGMEKAVVNALKRSLQKTDILIPWNIVILSTDGKIIE